MFRQRPFLATTSKATSYLANYVIRPVFAANAVSFLSIQNRFQSTTTQPKLFDKILIANRGEIACRVMRTCKRLGIKTVAIYSTADAQSLHVQLADEVYCVGPPPTNQSYLLIDKVMDAIKTSGAQAVHPGYGFLSENSLFSARLKEAGVAFLGPSAESIAAMGDKIESKRLAHQAQVNTIPGFDGVVRDLNHAIEIANDIKYPVMVKASGGGGGKGMRIAWNDAELADAWRLARGEALSSFGDDRMLVEKYIDNPRHIEIQVLGDTHGNIIYLNERECSIQRRNQKVIEEAPSPHLDEATRQAMGKQACMLAKAVGYHSAGTVEFLVDSQRNFYFLEMNTRLQVEHPITEKITGVDIVEQMIKVGAGLKLDYEQKDIKINGWAFESRVYAEDPVKYLPSIGRLSTYVEPKADDGTIRVDSGIIEGSEISMYYDPMIAKLVTWGPTRDTALQTMRDALDVYLIKGVKHNIPLLRDVCSHPRFIKGDISTKFLAEEYPSGFLGKKLSPTESNELIGTATLMHIAQYFRDQNFLNSEVIHPVNPFIGSTYVVSIQDAHKEVRSIPVVIKNIEDGKVTLELKETGETIEVASNWRVDSPLVETVVNGTSIKVQNLEITPLGFRCQHYGSLFEVSVQSERSFELSKHMPVKKQLDTTKVIMSPMPGTVISVSVEPGATVAEGQEVAVVEAMKMQNVLRSQRIGVVKKVLVKQGSTVSADEILIEFEDAK